ncbi:hypothetical protein TNCV_4410061 [Trichonephila clavipes]|nr:hypothetical protein TNCV_4410061 [Trichonephila clavipes]
MESQFSDLHLHNTRRCLSKDIIEQFKANKTTLAFIVKLLSTNSNEIPIESFGIVTGSLEMQWIDSLSTAFWSEDFGVEKQVGRYLKAQKKNVRSATKVDSFKRNAAS